MRHLVHLLVASTLAATTADGQQQSGPSAALAHADSAFMRQMWQPAADGYRTVVKDNSRNGMAWFRLATSLDHLDATDDAVAAYRHAIELGFQAQLAEFRVARDYALKGHNAEALAHLRKVAASGADPSIVDNEPAFASLRGSAEYAEIKQQAMDARYPCRKAHTFDFWVGDFTTGMWAAPNAPPGGELHNTREYEGCVIVERFTAGNGSGGMSMAFYDVSRKAWRMIWNDDQNGSSDFEGSYHDGAMRFEGWGVDANGNKLLKRNVLENLTPDLIRHVFSTSSDGGKTWVVQSDGRFVRKK